MANMEIITIWIVDRVAETVSLCTVRREYLTKYRLVMVLSDGEWLRAYEWIE